MEGHRIELHDEPRQIDVFVDGVTLASSTRVVVLRETGLPPRYYFPRDDVRMGLLEATPTETVCPFKGQASYWSVPTATGEHRDLAWSYETPVPGMERIARLVCFYAERADHAVDGRRQEPREPVVLGERRRMTPRLGITVIRTPDRGPTPSPNAGSAPCDANASTAT